MKKLLLENVGRAAMYLAVSALFAACAVQPATHANLNTTVDAVAPDNWLVDAPQSSADPALWWHQFGDPVMEQLVTSVLADNLDVQAALERVKQAQAITTQRRAD